MSAEGKKKRGLSGVANAKSIPFRYGNNGWRPPMSPAAVPPRKWNSETARGLYGGVIVAKLGYPMPVPSITLGDWLERRAEIECPVAYATLMSVPS